MSFTPLLQLHPGVLLLQFQGFAHPEEWYPAFLVSAGILVGGLVLLRVIFAGERRTAAVPLPSKTFARIVVPVDGRDVPEETFLNDAVPLACAMSDNTGIVDLTYVIEVPRALAVTASMPEEEAQAERLLKKAAAIVESCGLKPHPHIQKGRTFVDETARVVQESGADLLVLSLPTPQSPEGMDGAVTNGSMTSFDEVMDGRCGGSSRTGATLELGACDTCQTLLGRLLRRVNCEVVFARPASSL